MNNPAIPQVTPVEVAPVVAPAPAPVAAPAAPAAPSAPAPVAAPAAPAAPSAPAPAAPAQHGKPSIQSMPASQSAIHTDTNPIGVPTMPQQALQPAQANPMAQMSYDPAGLQAEPMQLNQTLGMPQVAQPPAAPAQDTPENTGDTPAVYNRITHRYQMYNPEMINNNPEHYALVYIPRDQYLTLTI